MPQFDYITFFNQTSWIFIILITFLIFISKYIVPFFGTVLKIREKRSFFYKNFFFDTLFLEKVQIFFNLEVAYENFFNKINLFLNLFFEKVSNSKNISYLLFKKDNIIFIYLKKLILQNILFFFFKFIYLKNKFKKIVKKKILKKKYIILSFFNNKLKTKNQFNSVSNESSLTKEIIVDTIDINTIVMETPQKEEKKKGGKKNKSKKKS